MGSDTRTPVEKAGRTEKEKLGAFGELMAYSYLSSTKAVDSLPEHPDEGDLVRTHAPALFLKVQALAYTLDKDILAKMQRIALLRFHQIIDFFDGVDVQYQTVVGMIAKTAAAAVGSVAVSAATSVFASPVTGRLMIVPAYGMFKSGIDLATWDFSSCDPKLLKYVPFCPSFPRLSYGFNPSSSGPWGKLKGLLVDNPSQTFGFVKLSLDQDYFFLFNLKRSEPLAPGVVWEMVEYVKQGLKAGLSVEEARKIQQLLSQATLLEAATHPKLLNPKTGAYFSSAIMEHLLVSTKEDDKVRLDARRLIEESIASNLMTVWPETKNRLNAVVQNFEKSRE